MPGFLVGNSIHKQAGKSNSSRLFFGVVKLRIIVPKFMAKTLFIVNPVSGRGNGRRLADFIMKSANPCFDPVVVFTNAKNDAKEIASANLREGIRRFVAVGGDGTVNEVASALVHTDGVMGIIPSGSGNGLARHLKIPSRVSLALRYILKDNIKTIDYGLIDEHAFFCVSGVGFDARIGQIFEDASGRGFICYAKNVLTEYFRYKPKKYRLLIDGKQIIHRRAFLITFANASQYGNNAYIAPGADVSDGLMDVCILRPFHVVKGIGFIYDLFANKLDKSNILEIIKCNEVELAQKDPGSIHFDGEPGVAGTNIRVKLISGGLKVLVP